MVREWLQLYAVNYLFTRLFDDLFLHLHSMVYLYGTPLLLTLMLRWLVLRPER